MKTIKSRLKIASLLTAGFALITMYTNCSEVGFENVKDPAFNGDLDEDDVEDALKTCEEAAAKGALKTLSQSLHFADTRVESGRAEICLFKPGPSSDELPDTNGNLTQKNDYLRSRYEQVAQLNLPANAVVCAADIQATKQNFYYDDIFYFTFNDKVLASSLKRSLDRTTKSTYKLGDKNIDVFNYDWSLLANSNFTGVNQSADNYCIGSAEGVGQCHWPLSQQSGKIEMGFNPEVLVPMSLANSSAVQRFGFTITGDNDPKEDCYHEDLDLNVTLQYFVK